MELVSDYMRDDTLRHALNELTRKTFCFDFESWVMGGYFEGDYIPYSFMENGKIISNVSANRMIFFQNDVEKHYIQIGTVMTDEAYRKKGLAKKLIEHVIKQYENECGGFYLFANLNAIDFYDKCGFSKEMEYRYSVKKEFCGKKSTGEIFMPVNTADEQMRHKYMDMVRHSVVHSSMEISINLGFRCSIQRIWKTYIMQRIWTVSLLQRWRKIPCFCKVLYVRTKCHSRMSCHE